MSSARCAADACAADACAAAQASSLKPASLAVHSTERAHGLKPPWSQPPVEPTPCGANPLQVRCPRVQLLKLTSNNFDNIDGIGAAIEAGALPELRVLILAACIYLTHLPEAIGQLAKLETLVLSDCNLLIHGIGLPKSLCKLQALRVLDLRGCTYSSTSSSAGKPVGGLQRVPAALRDRPNLNILV